jgi:hypothetical protein
MNSSEKVSVVKEFNAKNGKEKNTNEMKTVQEPLNTLYYNCNFRSPSNGVEGSEDALEGIEKKPDYLSIRHRINKIKNRKGPYTCSKSA